MTTTVQRKCKLPSCRKPIFPREADVKRGWGLYCDKSCKAIHQTQVTGYRGPHDRYDENGPRDINEEMNDAAMDVVGEGWDGHKDYF